MCQIWPWEHNRLNSLAPHPCNWWQAGQSVAVNFICIQLKEANTTQLGRPPARPATGPPDRPPARPATNSGTETNEKRRKRQKARPSITTCHRSSGHITIHNATAAADLWNMVGQYQTSQYPTKRHRWLGQEPSLLGRSSQMLGIQNTQRCFIIAAIRKQNKDALGRWRWCQGSNNNSQLKVCLIHRIS